jgi:hypothetical protein
MGKIVSIKSIFDGDMFMLEYTYMYVYTYTHTHVHAGWHTWRIRARYDEAKEMSKRMVKQASGRRLVDASKSNNRVSPEENTPQAQFLFAAAAWPSTVSLTHNEPDKQAEIVKGNQDSAKGAEAPETVCPQIHLHIN